MSRTRLGVTLLQTYQPLADDLATAPVGADIILTCTNIYFICVFKSGRKEGNVLFNDALNTIYGYMASDIWLRTILIVRKETRCHHIGYSYRLTARVLLYAPSHRQDSTYHGLCYTSRGALAGTMFKSMLNIYWEMLSAWTDLDLSPDTKTVQQILHEPLHANVKIPRNRKTGIFHLNLERDERANDFKPVGGLEINRLFHRHYNQIKDDVPQQWLRILKTRCC